VSNYNFLFSAWRHVSALMQPYSGQLKLEQGP